MSKWTRKHNRKPQLELASLEENKKALLLKYQSIISKASSTHRLLLKILSKAS